MSKLINAKTQTTAATATTESNGKDDPVKNCCTIPPDTDPGPIKP